MNMTNPQRDSRHSARKAAARRLQQTYPALKYTAAYAAFSPDAVVWRAFADAFSGDMYICSDVCLRVTEMLAEAGNGCPDRQGQQALFEVFRWSNTLSTRLVQVHSHTLFVNAVSPFAPTNLEVQFRLGDLPERPVSVGELDNVATETTFATAIVEPLRAEGALVPPEVLQVVEEIGALHRWVCGL